MRNVALCFVFAALACSAAAAKPAAQILPLGAVAPAFSLPDINGRQHALSEYRGRVTVLNFWAFWCDTWKAEMPHLNELAQQQDEQGFRIVAVSVDGTRLQEFRRRNKSQLPFPVLLDVGAATSQRYGIAHVPTVIILDTQGRVRYVHSGYPGNAVVLSQIRHIGSR